MVSLIRMVTTTTLRGVSLFSKVKPQTRCHLHKQIFAIPPQWQRTSLVRKVSIQSARDVIIAAASQKHGHIQLDAETMNSFPSTCSFPKTSNPSQADCLMGLLLDISEIPYKKDNAEWQKIQKLVNDLEPTVIAETFKRLYLACTFDGNIQAGYSSLALLKLFTGHLLTIPRKEEFSLDALRDHFREVILALPLSYTNLRRILEFFICVQPQSLRSFFWFNMPEGLQSEFLKIIKGYEYSIL